MAVVKGVIREIGRSRTVRFSARKWGGYTTIIVQNEKTGQTYSVNLSAKTMERSLFLPKIGMPVIVHGYVEETEYGTTDYVVSRVTKVKRDLPDQGAKKVVRFDE